MSGRGDPVRGLPQEGGGPWWRSTALHREMAYVGGALYASGGLLVLVTVVLPSWPMYAEAWVGAVGVVAVLVGAFFLWAAERLLMPLWQYAVATTLGAVLVTIVVVAGGPDALSTYAVLYVFVSAYGFYYYPWPLAAWMVVLSGAGFAVALAWHDAEGALVRWVVVVGAVVIAGGLIGSLGRRVRHLYALEQTTVEALSERDRWKTTFLRAVAHDLRSPLTSMVGLMRVVRDQSSRLSDEQRQQFVERAVLSGQRLTRLVEDLLDLERIEAGELAPRREAASLDDVVRAGVASLDLEDRDVTLDLAPVVAHVEAAKVERIVANLVSNALRHTPRDADVWVRVRAQDDVAVLTVEDSGPGLPEEVREGLFEAFHAGAVVGETHGVGLGLHLVRQFTQLHGGTVEALDRPGGGARFEVRLPIGAAVEAGGG